MHPIGSSIAAQSGVGKHSGSLIMPYSFHSHSGQYCKHGYGLLEDVVKEAIRKGFKIYGLSEHMPRLAESELYPEELEVNLPIHLPQHTHVNPFTFRLHVLQQLLQLPLQNSDNTRVNCSRSIRTRSRF